MEFLSRLKPLPLHMSEGCNSIEGSRNNLWGAQAGEFMGMITYILIDWILSLNFSIESYCKTILVQRQAYLQCYLTVILETLHF